MNFVEQKNSIWSERGFTLMEMVIAVTLVAAMAVGLWSVFSISIRSWSRGTQFIDANQRHRSITDMVRKQIASTYGLSTQGDLQSGGVIYPIFSGTETSLRLISLSSLRFQENPGLTQVFYDVVQENDGSYSLVEREERYLGQNPDEESFLIPKDQKLTTIFRNLSSLTFEYFDPGDDEKPPRWVKEWDGQEMLQLPMAISMAMMSQDTNGNAVSRHLVVPIHAKFNNPRRNLPNILGQARGRGLRQ